MNVILVNFIEINSDNCFGKFVIFLLLLLVDLNTLLYNTCRTYWRYVRM